MVIIMTLWIGNSGVVYPYLILLYLYKEVICLYINVLSLYSEVLYSYIDVLSIYKGAIYLYINVLSAYMELYIHMFMFYLCIIIDCLYIKKKNIM